MRSRFDGQLAQLNREMIEMGALCEEIISMVSDALTQWDDKLNEHIMPVANAIDQKERDIEALCLKMLLQQQPVAKDLRVISAALKMITDMERIGDQAEDIAEIITYLDGRTVTELHQIRQMANATIRMVTESVDAYVKQDIALAQAAIAHDDIVDQFFDEMKHLLIEWISKKPEHGEFALDLLMICKYFERIGDHATNIAEWVIFSVTGTHEEASC